MEVWLLMTLIYAFVTVILVVHTCCTYICEEYAKRPTFFNLFLFVQWIFGFVTYITYSLLEWQIIMLVVAYRLYWIASVTLFNERLGRGLPNLWNRTFPSALASKILMLIVGLLAATWEVVYGIRWGTTIQSMDQPLGPDPLSWVFAYTSMIYICFYLFGMIFLLWIWRLSMLDLFSCEKTLFFDASLFVLHPLFIVGVGWLLAAPFYPVLLEWEKQLLVPDILRMSVTLVLVCFLPWHIRRASFLDSPSVQVHNGCL